MDSDRNATDFGASVTPACDSPPVIYPRVIFTVQDLQEAQLNQWFKYCNTYQQILWWHLWLGCCCLLGQKPWELPNLAMKVLISPCLLSTNGGFFFLRKRKHYNETPSCTFRSQSCNRSYFRMQPKCILNNSMQSCLWICWGHRNCLTSVCVTFLCFFIEF